ncbi:MAG TPA: NADH-quinone oxidoreductase subunit L, partial [Acidimicrobiia bacterium]|nr:NADH-quinone oxidoreductase subunit L [Acidimicrobiia bacterium]
MLNIVWLLPALPLFGFGILLLYGRRLGDPKAGWLATTMVAGAFVAAAVVCAGLFLKSPDHRVFTQT